MSKDKDTSESKVIKNPQYEKYIAILLEGSGELRSKSAIAEELDVDRGTLYNWDKTIDWDWIKSERRKKYSPRMVAVDDAMFRQAVKGDVAAAKYLAERFDSYLPTSQSIVSHELDEGLIDDELKRLMGRRIDTANALDNSRGEAVKGTDRPETVSPAE